MDIRRHRLALSAGLALLISGCASAPQLKGSTLDQLGKTEVVYVTPKDDIVVTDPAMTELAHAGKFVALTGLTGGYFGAADLGAAAYFAGNKFPGGMEGRIEAAHKVFVDQHWEERMRAAAQAGVDASRLQGATWITLDHQPSEDEIRKLTAEGGFHSLVSLAPEIQMATEGDHMRILLHVRAVTPRTRLACRDCDNTHAGEEWNHVDGSQALEASQYLVAVDGGKTWEEQKQAGHRLHDLTEGDYAMFWLLGDPPPLKTFMDAGFQSLQAQLSVYFGGQAKIPAPLPTLKLVVNP